MLWRLLPPGYMFIKFWDDFSWVFLVSDCASRSSSVFCCLLLSCVCCLSRLSSLCQVFILTVMICPVRVSGLVFWNFDLIFYLMSTSNAWFMQKWRHTTTAGVAVREKTHEYRRPKCSLNTILSAQVYATVSAEGIIQPEHFSAAAFHVNAHRFCPTQIK